MIPIILHHGLLGFPSMKAGPLKFRYFRKIDQVLAARGHPVIITRVHPTAGIETRARQLKETILRQLDILGRRGERVVIVAHSMGGLDARFMISQLGMEERVASLLTVTTPHRGSPYADWCVRYLGQKLGGLRLMRALGLDVQAVNDLTTESCRRFNEDIPDSPAVRYFSISAARPWHRVPPFALHSFKVIAEAEGENDGLVSVKSSTWARHLGVWPADHWHTINHRLVLELKDPTGDITPYYLDALERMKAEGVALQDS
jgi:triacylglycerol lipase